MEEVGVFLAGVFVIWLAFWTISNEKAKSIGDQRGLFRMRNPDKNLSTVKKSDGLEHPQPLQVEAEPKTRPKR